LSAADFGRVDAENNVFVLDSGVERQVGQYPGVSAEEALAYFVRKFEDLEAQVRILEQRLQTGAGDFKSIKSAHETLTKELLAPNAVGDLQQLRDRLVKLSGKLEAAGKEQQAKRAEEVAAALAEKESIAARAEAIVAKLEKVNWKKAGAEMTELFERWQTLQKNGARVPKSQADPIWKRFSQARAKFESGRRAFFATLDTQTKEARSQKQELVDLAEALVTKGGEGAADYRKLQDRWKLAPKAGKAEEALWKKFRAAGDKIFAAKKLADEAADAEQKANLAAKLELLKEAEAIDATDLTAASKALSDVQARWVKIGHVPKADVRKVEDRLRKVERKLQDAQNEHWKRTDPAAKDRSNALVEQLEAAIADLEAQAAANPKDKKLVDAIATRRTWLEAAKNAVD
jgi:hypothetical protein